MILQGSGYSSAVEPMPCDTEVVGSNPAGPGLFSTSILSNVTFKRYLEEVLQYCFSSKKYA